MGRSTRRALAAVGILTGVLVVGALAGMAMALASAGPIQMGSTRSPSVSCSRTTGVRVFWSSPRLCTRSRIICPA